MNDRHDPYGQIYGYDEYGRPLYRAAAEPGQQQPAAPPAQDGNGYGYGYPAGTGTGTGTGEQPAYGGDYATGPAPGQYGGYGGGGYDYGGGYATGQQPPVPPAPPAAGGYQGHDGYASDPSYAPDPSYGVQPQQHPHPHPQPAQPQPTVPPQRRPADGEGGERVYQTEQFSFVDEQNDESEDVIDWLKFTESRTERREEAKRRGRNRRRLLVITLVLAVLGGAGYLWATDRLPAIPGLEAPEEAAPAAQQRDVIVVHLQELDGDETSTALLVANETTEHGTTLLLPNDLAVTADGEPTTLGQAVGEEASGAVRDAVGGLLGADIKGTWRLDTPYLELLVDAVGGITLDTNAEVQGNGGDGDGPLVPKGEGTDLTGQAAVAYATHLGEGEPQTAQLERFGQVMQAVLDKLPTSESTALDVVNSLQQIPDPSLSAEQLAASLSHLATYAQDGEYDTTLLPVRGDGTLSDETASTVVKDVLGGTVSDDAGSSAAPRIGIRDASGTDGAAEEARITLVNGGFTVVDARPADEAVAESEVTYADEADRETALEAARTLGLPESAVRQDDGATTTDVTIVLGEDYEGEG